MPWVLMFVMAPFAVGPAGLLDHVEQYPDDRAAAMAVFAPVPGAEDAGDDVTQIDLEFGADPELVENARASCFRGTDHLPEIGAQRLSICRRWSVNEVAFAGRSNVGKSSLINALTNRNSGSPARRTRRGGRRN